MAEDPAIIPDPAGGAGLSAKPPKRKRKRKAGKGDRAPRAEKSGAAKRAERKAEDLRVIREAFGELLSAPAALAAAKGDEWAVDHFTTAGPALADRIVIECERNEKLRARLVTMASGSGYIMLGTAVGAYLLPPLIHYGLIPGLPGMGDVPRPTPAPAGPRPGQAPPFHQPPRPQEDRPATEPSAPPAPADEAAPPGSTLPSEPGEGPLMPADPLAAELAAAENGGPVPPPPVEAV